MRKKERISAHKTYLCPAAIITDLVSFGVNVLARSSHAGLLCTHTDIRMYPSKSILHYLLYYTRIVRPATVYATANLLFLLLFAVVFVYGSAAAASIC